MAPLVVAAGIAAAAFLSTWIGSLITKENSWVDRLWSIVPVLYVWVFAGFAGFADPRLNVMAVLVSLWGARLTFNFARKGGYSGVEDYRWPILRKRMSPAQFQLFNLLFIALFQNLVLFLIALPALSAYQHRATPFGPLDLTATVAFLALLAGETVADQQQWNFHRTKRAGGENFQPRFLQNGMWRYSRHPNYFFELAQWWVLFGFGAIAAGSLLQWTVVGPILLTALFIGSTIFTESITRSRYPEYADYQARTSPIVPAPPRRVRQTRPSLKV